MKLKEKNEARRLRQEEGLAINEIAKQLNVAKSSVSLWVRDIELTEEQKQKLLEQNPCHNSDFNGMKEKHRKIRLNYQKIGKEEAKEWKNNPLHMAGCMLYWAEGEKNRNRVYMSNSDPNLLKIFKEFLQEFYKIPNEKFKIYIHCHNAEDAIIFENKWLEELSLCKDNLGKTTILNSEKHNTGKRSNKLYIGMCKLGIESTEINQRIFGAIQYYGNFDRENWK